MSNYLHAVVWNRLDVVQEWSAVEVGNLWCRLFPQRRDEDDVAPLAMTNAALPRYHWLSPIASAPNHAVEMALAQCARSWSRHAKTHLV